MERNDMILVGVDDHLIEPASLGRMLRVCRDPGARLGKLDADGSAVQLDYPTTGAIANMMGIMAEAAENA